MFYPQIVSESPRNPGHMEYLVFLIKTRNLPAHTLRFLRSQGEKNGVCEPCADGVWLPWNRLQAKDPGLDPHELRRVSHAPLDNRSSTAGDGS